MESNTTVLPQECSSRLLNHLGLVAGMYDELGLGELIDSLIPQDKEKRVVSVGQTVKAMVVNGLGFANRVLYQWFGKFCFRLCKCSRRIQQFFIIEVEFI